MRLTLRHFYDFGRKADLIGNDLHNPHSWEKLRQETETPDIFSIPKNANRWREKCLNDSLLNARAEKIISFLDPSINKIYSFGVGTACLEYLLKTKKPQIFLQCSDFTVMAVGHLKSIFKEADEVLPFDMLKDSWMNAGAECLYLFHRIDTEFTDKEWQLILKRMQTAEIQNILFIPSQILTVPKIIYYQFKRLYYKLFNKKVTLAGYIRTEDQLRFILSCFYQIEKVEKIGDLKGYLLKLKN